MAEGKESRAPISARIHVLVAREKPYAVVIRRGPSKQVCTIGWNLRTDEFVIGQWLKGRIRERRCDLSPNGRLMIYFAMNGRWESETRGSWTAISCAPYLKAIGLWGNGSTWNGGGLFVSNREYWIHENPMDRLMRRPDKLTRVFSHGGRVAPSGEDPGVYYPRLMRDGWRVVETGEPNTQRNRIQAVTIFEKDVIDSWVLRKFAHATPNHPEGKGNYFDEHELVETPTGKVIDASEWEWADYVRGRLLWSTCGAIFAGKLTANGVDEERMLRDFNDMTFEPIKAPY